MSTLAFDADTRRLGMSLVIASLLHALVIFGITFVAPPSNPGSMIEVTLALHRDAKADEHADFLAAANQQGGGQSAKAQEMTSPQSADFTDARIAEVRPEDKASFTPPPEQTRRQLLMTQGASRRLPPEQPQKEIPLRTPDDGVLAASAQTAAIASLEARLAEQRQALARKQRIHTVSTLSARSDISAAWIDDFRQKVERTGNRHYPEQARARRLQGEVRLLVAISAGGEIREIRTLKSSGQVLLDEAARRSVQLSAPFRPFSREMRKEMDVLQIIRTWRFAERMTNQNG